MLHMVVASYSNLKMCESLVAYCIWGSKDKSNQLLHLEANLLRLTKELDICEKPGVSSNTLPMIYKKCR